MFFLLLTKEESEYDILGQNNYDFSTNHFLSNQTVQHIGDYYILEIPKNEGFCTQYLIASMQYIGYNRPLSFNTVFSGRIVDDTKLLIDRVMYNGNFIEFRNF